MTLFNIWLTGIKPYIVFRKRSNFVNIFRFYKFLITGLFCLDDYSSDIAIEFCLYDTFSWSCPPETLIAVSSATFGRQGSARCQWGEEVNTTECLAEVTSYVSESCTGSEKCLMPRQEKFLEAAAAAKCSYDRYASLLVIYRCVPGLLRSISILVVFLYIAWTWEHFVYIYMKSTRSM